jgi:tRNA(Ile)-lysidine synthase
MTDPFILPVFPFPSKARLIAGVSGGSDSMGLLLWLMEKMPAAKGRLVAAHVNYGLRGRDSRRDEEEVRRFCRKRLLPLRILRLKGFKARVRSEGRSLQDLAREVRYSFFLDLVKKEKAWGAAVAHHREDQAETVLDRILRGAGSRGLSGLRPIAVLRPGSEKTPLRVWRPFLDFPKARIRDYVRSKGASWREDRSNLDPAYRRNQIRRKIIPFLSRWNPGFSENLVRIASISASEDAFLDEILGSWAVKIGVRRGKRGFTCRAAAFARMPLALQRRWVRRACAGLNPRARGLSFERVEEIIRLWAGKEKGPRDMGFGLAAGEKGGRAYLRLKSG